MTATRVGFEFRIQEEKSDGAKCVEKLEWRINSKLYLAASDTVTNGD